jgi:hypothetical protein
MILSKLKNKFFHAFREIFLYHHNSLEFRAKLFAMFIAVNNRLLDEELEIVRTAAQKIYGADEARVDALVYTTQEYVNKVLNNNGLGINELTIDITNELKKIPRYHKKIDTTQLLPLLEYSIDEETRIYQKNIIKFFDQLKSDYTIKK